MGMFENSAASPDLDFERQMQEGQEGQGADNQQQQGTEGQQGQQLDGQQGQQQNNAQEPPEGQQGEGQEQLILGKFKSQDDLVKAYQAAEKRMGQMRNEMGQLRSQPQHAQQQQTQGQQGQQAQQQDQEIQWTPEQWQAFNQNFQQEFTKNPGQAIWQMVNDAITQVVNPLYQTVQGQQQQQMKSMMVNNEMDLLLTALNEQGQPLYPDALNYSNEIADYMAKHPYLEDMLFQQAQTRQAGQIDEKNMGVLEVIYRAAKSEAAESMAKTAFQNGVQQGTMQRQVKNTAQMQQPGARQQNNTSSPEEQILNEIFAHKKGGFFI
ncbi:MAG: hypothetical protein VR72_02965 [Clostridiaceae bacterium BRH_c20a]|nr:MAG: hypothetical protein VR72_02965 [Clostridiaceae bacterium BRH_c20a]